MSGHFAFQFHITGQGIWWKCFFFLNHCYFFPWRQIKKIFCLNAFKVFSCNKSIKPWYGNFYVFSVDSRRLLLTFKIKNVLDSMLCVITVFIFQMSDWICLLISLYPSFILSSGGLPGWWGKLHCPHSSGSCLGCPYSYSLGGLFHWEEEKPSQWLWVFLSHLPCVQIIGEIHRILITVIQHDYCLGFDDEMQILTRQNLILSSMK